MENDDIKKNYCYANMNPQYLSTLQLRLFTPPDSDNLAVLIKDPGHNDLYWHRLIKPISDKKQIEFYKNALTSNTTEYDRAPYSEQNLGAMFSDTTSDEKQSECHICTLIYDKKEYDQTSHPEQNLSIVLYDLLSYREESYRERIIECRKKKENNHIHELMAFAVGIADISGKNNFSLKEIIPYIGILYYGARKQFIAMSN